MQAILEFCVENSVGEMKIRDYMTKKLGFSTSLIAKVKCGGVILNGSVVHMRAMVKGGDLIKISLPAEQSEGIPGIEMPLDIVYEDDCILVINKPKNMPVHPSLGNSLPTLANGVMAYMGGNFVFRAANRLDRDTSGLVVVAKNQLASAKLSRIIKDGKFKKKYRAIVCGIPQKSGFINAPIERECEGAIKRVVRPDGKPSVTEYKLISTNSDGNSVVEINLLTGRTHQIRVHFAYIGHPLVNDFLYGERIGFDTYRLHCCELSFPHPKTDELLNIKAEGDF